MFSFMQITLHWPLLVDDVLLVLFIEPIRTSGKVVCEALPEAYFLQEVT